MCYIFNCFGWALDFVQRLLTFILACILCGIIVIGVLVAVAAGVAYGYNYSMAEFLTFTRQDTTVYMRRGQFYDRPDFDSPSELMSSRRSGGGQSEYSINKSVDQQGAGMPRSETKGVLDSWGKVRDARKYAEILTKFSRKPENEDSWRGDLDLTTAPPSIIRTPPPSPPPPPPPVVIQDRITIQPNPQMVSTSYIDTGTTQIMMRHYKPLPTMNHPIQTAYYPDSEIWKSKDKARSRAETKPLFSDEEVKSPQIKPFPIPPSWTTRPVTVPDSERRKNKLVTESDLNKFRLNNSSEPVPSNESVLLPPNSIQKLVSQTIKNLSTHNLLDNVLDHLSAREQADGNYLVQHDDKLKQGEENYSFWFKDEAASTSGSPISAGSSLYSDTMKTPNSPNKVIKLNHSINKNNSLHSLHAAIFENNQGSSPLPKEEVSTVKLVNIKYISLDYSVE